MKAALNDSGKLRIAFVLAGIGISVVWGAFGSDSRDPALKPRQESVWSRNPNAVTRPASETRRRNVSPIPTTIRDSQVATAAWFDEPTAQAPAQYTPPAAASLGLPVIPSPRVADGSAASPNPWTHNDPMQPVENPVELPLEVWPNEIAELPAACLSGLPGMPVSPVEPQPSPYAAQPYGDPAWSNVPPGSVDPATVDPQAYLALAAAGSWNAPAEGYMSGANGTSDWANAPQVAWGTGEGQAPEQAGAAGHAEPIYRPRSDLASVDAFFNPHRNATEAGRVLFPSDPCDCDPHAEVFSETPFPSAIECSKCHRQIYEEWAVSNHAYAGISPMFHRFEDTLNKLAGGTVGYFCLRCHAPVATSMGLRRDQPIWAGPRVFREGVTCVACHRVTEHYGKTNGERRMEPGDLMSPVVGAGDGLGVERVLNDADHFKVRDVPTGTGQIIHRRAIQFEELNKSTFCVSCHQVAVYPNIKLEVVWDQYIASPAYREGITCQDCHMGKVPGLAEGYTLGPAAIIEGKPVLPERKHSNHGFYGPGYSIAHPGVFPHNEKADRWTMPEWLLFDWRAGWGTDAFEEALERGEFSCDFPEPWNNVDDRYDAAEILTENFRLLDYKRELRRQVMENGSRIDGPYFSTGCMDNGELVVPQGRDLPLHYVVTNLNSGHNLPTASLGAQPQLWLNVVLIDPCGQRVWESGYLDSLGDLADLQSTDVLAGRLRHDDQLFNLQTKFLITNVKGTDREVYLPVNTDIDQLPFIRPPGLPVSVLNHPPLIRMEAHSLPPLGTRNACYKIPGEVLQTPGWYRLSIRMRSRAEPMYFMRFVGATDEMTRRMMEETADVHPSSVLFRVE